MTHDAALALIADHPHAWRYRQLCEDASDLERRDAYRGLVVRLATGQPTPAPVVVSYGDPTPVRPCCPNL